jgi:hypothetical protein
MTKREAGSGRMGWGELFLLVLVLLVAFPREALAFGPATHIDLGLHVLRYAALLPFAVRRVISSYPETFLYGGFAADVVVGKNLARHVHHCHNWDVGFRMLDEAPTAEIKALCWGFLAHLGADVIAHNYFIPFKLVCSYEGRMTRHVYWEVRFDQANHDSDGVWRTLQRLGRARFPEADGFLRDELSRSSRLLPFDVSRRLFNSFMLLSRAEKWREMTSNVADRSRWSLSEEEFTDVRRRALDNVFGVLVDGRNAAVASRDPTGKQVLGQAKKLRRKLKRKMRRGRVGVRLGPAGEALLQQRLFDVLDGRGGALPTFAEIAAVKVDNSK